MSLTHSSPSHSKCFSILPSLCSSVVPLPLSALADSGAEDNFVDEVVAQQASFPIELLETPIVVRTLDGKFLALITHQTTPLQLILSGNHRELISLKLMQSPSAPIVLGHPWLLLHNPHTDWAAGKIINWSSYCHSVCLQSASHPQRAVFLLLSIKPLTFPVSWPLTVTSPEFSVRPVPCLCGHIAPTIALLTLFLGPPTLLIDSTTSLTQRGRPRRNTLLSPWQLALFAPHLRPSSSPLGAVFFFVDKKDKTLRPSIDYCGLNQITVKNKYPLPLLFSAFEPLHGAIIFTKLDLRNAYHLVRIREGDDWKTAFNTPRHFEYLVMPFGLSNAPAVFQALVNDILRDFLNRFVFVYLDNILILSRSLEEHIPHVRLVLQRLLENRLYVKVEKCEFHASSVTFLGDIIKSGQLEADPEKIKAVAEWPVPTSVKQLQRFLGFASFYHRFIKNYSSVAPPLTRLTSSVVLFSWSPQADAASPQRALHLSPNPHPA